MNRPPTASEIVSMVRARLPSLHHMQLKRVAAERLERIRSQSLGDSSEFDGGQITVEVTREYLAELEKRE